MEVIEMASLRERITGRAKSEASKLRTGVEASALEAKRKAGRINRKKVVNALANAGGPAEAGSGAGFSARDPGGQSTADRAADAAMMGPPVNATLDPLSAPEQTEALTYGSAMRDDGPRVDDLVLGMGMGTSPDAPASGGDPRVDDMVTSGGMNGDGPRVDDLVWGDGDGDGDSDGDDGEGFFSFGGGEW